MNWQITVQQKCFIYFSLDFWIVPYSQKVQTVHVDWFSQTLLVFKRWRKPPEKSELAKCLEKFYLSGREKADRRSTKQLLPEALELVKKKTV